KTHVAIGCSAARGPAQIGVLIHQGGAVGWVRVAGLAGRSADSGKYHDGIEVEGRADWSGDSEVRSTVLSISEISIADIPDGRLPCVGICEGHARALSVGARGSVVL